MKIRLLALLFVLAALIGAIAPAPAASLRPNAIVEADTVRLGDIFEDAGPKTDTPVLYSPAPGRRVTLSAAWLSEVARIFQVAWRPTSQSDSIVVERAGKLVTAADILVPLRRELAAQGMSEHAEVELVNRNFTISLPLDVPSTIEVRNMTYDATTGQFNALLLAGGDRPGAQRMMVQGRTYAATSVPVLRRPMSTGEIIRKDDLELVYRRDDLLGRDVVTDPNRIIGKTPQNRLRAGDVIHEQDTCAPILVTRNSQVVIKLQAGAMTLTAQGKALDQGARGEVIRVQNLQSNKTIEATVTGPDLVMITLGPRVAATN